jgi:hypothetical protein
LHKVFIKVIMNPIKENILKLNKEKVFWSKILILTILSLWKNQKKKITKILRMKLNQIIIYRVKIKMKMHEN